MHASVMALVLPPASVIQLLISPQELIFADQGYKVLASATLEAHPALLLQLMISKAGVPYPACLARRPAVEPSPTAVELVRLQFPFPCYGALPPLNRLLLVSKKSHFLAELIDCYTWVPRASE